MEGGLAREDFTSILELMELNSENKRTIKYLNYILSKDEIQTVIAPLKNPTTHLLVALVMSTNLKQTHI